MHIPFCLSKCFYCDFYSVPVAGQDIDRFLRALLVELEREIEGLAERRGSWPLLKSLYIGGGTPTCLPAECLVQLLEKCQEILGIKAGKGRAAFSPGAAGREVEITVEANPGTLEGNKLYWIRKAGANRLSLGIQSLDREMLKTLGRRHTVEEALAALQEARGAGFKNVGIDLLLGLPGQTVTRWSQELPQVVALGAEHLSVYLLSIEPGTKFYREQQEGRLSLPGEDIEAALYEETVAYLTACGYHHYEISNFACPGYECAHNLIYWDNAEYLGVGPAAWSFIREGENAVRRGNVADVEVYCQRIEAGKEVVAVREEVSKELEIAETVILGLRRTAGISRHFFQERFGKNIDEVYGSTIAELEARGLLRCQGDAIRLSRRGLLLANQVWIRFLPPVGLA